MSKILISLKQKWAEYLLEMIVITLSIVGAFMLENWNAERQERTIEQQYLQRYQNELILQRDQLKTAEEFCISKIRIAQSILSNYQLNQEFGKNDSLNSKLGSLMWITGYPSISSAYNDMTSSGQLRLIQNNDVREQLVEYYENNQTRNKYFDDNISSVFYPQIFPIFKEAVYIDLKEFRVQSTSTNSASLYSKHIDFLKGKLSDPQKELNLINTVSLYLALMNSNKNLISTALTDCESLIDLIGKENSLSD